MRRRIRHPSFLIGASSLIGLLVAAAGCGSSTRPVTERTSVARPPASRQERAGVSVGGPTVHRSAPPHGSRADKSAEVQKAEAARHPIASEAHRRAANRSVAADHNAEGATGGHRPPGPAAGEAGGRDPNCCGSGSVHHASPTPEDANSSPSGS